MSFEVITQCPVCNRTSFRHFNKCKDYTTTQEDFNLIECLECNFIITSPRPDHKEIGRYYKSDKYISHTGGSNNLVDKIYLIARSYALSKKRKLIEAYAKGKTLLDYGSGTGEFLKHCKSNNWQVEGVEPSNEARLKSSQYTDIQIHIDIKSIKGKKFSIITLWHVLEHVHSLNITLKELADSLEEDGTLIIAVPNPESYDAKKYKEHWAAYDVPRHLWHFKKENISSLLKQVGLTLVATKPMKLDSFYVSLLSEGNKNKNHSKIRQMISAFFTGLISNRKARNQMNYSSLIYIASR